MMMNHPGAPTALPRPGMGMQAPQAQPTPQPTAAPPLGPSERHEKIAANYDKLMGLQKQLEVVRSQFDAMQKLGDTITQDDVVEAAGRLVAKGLDTKTVATMLSEMPQDGPQLAGFIKTKEATLLKNEQALAQAIPPVREALGHAAMQSIMSKTMPPLPTMAVAPGLGQGPVPSGDQSQLALAPQPGGQA